tara:strand:+ start:866 stop:1492 length:627 start_codon:yes stop_codon:yes gene_type:complete
MSSILKVDKIVSQTGATTYLENGTLKNVVIDSSCTFGPGRSDQFIVKHKFCSATTVDQSFVSGDGTSFLTGAEIDMGIPAKANNWFRVYFQSIMDDNASPNTGGIGYHVYRKLGSGDFTEILGQGEHAIYTSDGSDNYDNADILCYIGAANATENHTFRIYVNAHSHAYRLNCNIGQDNRNGGWQNNILEITEYDGDLVDNGNLTVGQ